MYQDVLRFQFFSTSTWMFFLMEFLGTMCTMLVIFIPALARGWRSKHREEISTELDAPCPPFVSLFLSLPHYVLDTFHMFQLSTWQFFFQSCFFFSISKPAQDMGIFPGCLGCKTHFSKPQHLKTPWKHRLDAGNRISESRAAKKGHPYPP